MAKGTISTSSRMILRYIESGSGARRLGIETSTTIFMHLIWMTTIRSKKSMPIDYRELKSSRH